MAAASACSTLQYIIGVWLRCRMGTVEFVNVLSAAPSVLIPRVWNGKPLRLGQLACYVV